MNQWHNLTVESLVLNEVRFLYFYHLKVVKDFEQFTPIKRVIREKHLHTDNWMLILLPVEAITGWVARN